MVRGNPKLNDDILTEIFGYLSAADVLRCRQVCKRMSRVSRELALWSTLYRRSACPLPTLDRTLPVAKLERLVNRAEVLDAEWTDPHPTILNIHDFDFRPARVSMETSACVGIKGPYVIFLSVFTRAPSITFHWYKIDNPKGSNSNPIFQYNCAKPRNMGLPSPLALDNGFSYGMDSESGALYIASACKSGDSLYLTSIELGEKFVPRTQIIEMSVWKATSFYGVKIVNGFAVCSRSSWSESQVIEIICARTSKKIRMQVRSRLPPKVVPHLGTTPTSYKATYTVTPCHLIRTLDNQLIEVFNLPDTLGTTGSSNDTEMDTSYPLFFGSLPQLFLDIGVFPSPQPTSLVFVGAGGVNSLGPGRTFKVTLMTVDTAKHSIEVIKEVVMSGVAVAADRRLTLTHHPETHCIAGIVVTRTSATGVYDNVAVFADPEIYQTLKYIKVLQNNTDDPIMVVNELRIPGQIANKLQSFAGVDVHNGRVIFGYRHGLHIEHRFGILDYLRVGEIGDTV